MKQRWLAQAEELRKTFPSFSWEESLKHEDFCVALLEGCSVFEAYMIKVYNLSTPMAREVIKVLATEDHETLQQLANLMEQKKR